MSWSNFFLIEAWLQSAYWTLIVGGAGVVVKWRHTWRGCSRTDGRKLRRRVIQWRWSSSRAYRLLARLAIKRFVLDHAPRIEFVSNQGIQIVAHFNFRQLRALQLCKSNFEVSFKPFAHNIYAAALVLEQSITIFYLIWKLRIRILNRVRHLSPAWPLSDVLQLFCGNTHGTSNTDLTQSITRQQSDHNITSCHHAHVPTELANRHGETMRHANY